MRRPNLASRPLLNTRPVWVLTAAATALGLVLLGFNLTLYFRSTHETGAQLERRAELVTRSRALAAEVRAERRSLDAVKWKPLVARVDALNLVLRSYSFSWIRLLDDLEAVLPWQVRLYRVTPNVSPDGFYLTIGGAAQTRDAMLQLLENLIKDPHFREPIPRSETPPEGASSPGYQFDLKVEYLPEGEAP